eukprot:5976887-Prymnesium_polylepis.1
MTNCNWQLEIMILTPVRDHSQLMVVSNPGQRCLGKSVIFFQTRAGDGLAARGRSVRPWKDMQ